MKLKNLVEQTRKRIKYKVLWVNPENHRLETYQKGLTKKEAERLAYELKYGFGARWFDTNPETYVEEDPS